MNAKNSLPIADPCDPPLVIDAEAIATAIAEALANLDQINVAFDPTKWSATPYCDETNTIKGTHFVCLLVDGDGSDDGEPIASEYWVPTGGEPVPGPPPADCKPCGPPFTYDDDGNLCVSIVQKPGTKLAVEMPTVLSSQFEICGPDGATGTCFKVLAIPTPTSADEAPMVCQLVMLGSSGLMGVNCCPDETATEPGAPVQVEYYCTPDGITNELPDGWNKCEPLPSSPPECYEVVNWRRWVDNHSVADRPPGLVMWPRRNWVIKAKYDDGNATTGFHPAVTAAGSPWGPSNDQLAAALGGNFVGPSAAASDGNPAPADGDIKTPYGAYAHEDGCPRATLVEVLACPADADGNLLLDENGDPLAPVPLAFGTVVTSERVWLCKVKSEPVAWENDAGETIPAPDPKCLFPCGTAPTPPPVSESSKQIDVFGPLCEWVPAADPNDDPTQVDTGIYVVFCNAVPADQYTLDANGDPVEHEFATEGNYYGDCESGAPVAPPEIDPCTEPTIEQCEIGGRIAWEFNLGEPDFPFTVDEGGLIFVVCGETVTLPEDATYADQAAFLAAINAGLTNSTALASGDFLIFATPADCTEAPTLKPGDDPALPFVRNDKLDETATLICALWTVGKNDDRRDDGISTIASAVGTCSCGTTVGDTSTAEYVNSDNETDATNGVGDVDADGQPDDTKWSFENNEPDVESMLVFTEDCLNEGGEVRWDWVNTDGDPGTQTFEADDWTRTGLNVQIANEASGSSGKIQRITATCTKAGEGAVEHTCMKVHDECVEAKLDALIDAVNDRPDRIEYEYYCDTESGTVQEIIVTNGVKAAPVDLGVECVPDQPVASDDFEQSVVCRDGTRHLITTSYAADGTPTELSATDTGEKCTPPKYIGDVKYRASLDEWDTAGSTLVGTTGGRETVQVGPAQLTVEIEDNGQNVNAYAGGLAPVVGGYGPDVQAARCMRLSWDVPEGCVLTYRITGNYLQIQGGPRIATRFDPCPTNYRLNGARQVFENGWLFTEGGNSSAVNDGIAVKVAGSGSVNLTLGHTFNGIGTVALRGVEVACYRTAAACIDQDGLMTYTDPATGLPVDVGDVFGSCPIGGVSTESCGDDCSCAGSCCEDLSATINDTNTDSPSWYNSPVKSKCPTDRVHYRIGDIEPFDGNPGRAWVMMGLTSFPLGNYYTHLDYAAYTYAPNPNVRYLYAYENNQNVGGGIVQRLSKGDEVCVVRRGEAVVMTVNDVDVFTFPTAPSDKPLYASSAVLDNAARGEFTIKASTCKLPELCGVNCCGDCDEWPTRDYITNDWPNNGWNNQGPYSTCPVTSTCWKLSDREDRMLFMFGLGRTDPTQSASYTTFTHRVYYYQTATGAVRIGVYDDGAFQGWLIGPADIPAESEICVRQLPDGHISYTLNGVEFYRSAAPETARLYADSSIYGGAASAYWTGRARFATENCR